MLRFVHTKDTKPGPLQDSADLLIHLPPKTSLALYSHALIHCVSSRSVMLALAPAQYTKLLL